MLSDSFTCSQNFAYLTNSKSALDFVVIPEDTRTFLNNIPGWESAPQRTEDIKSSSTDAILRAKKTDVPVEKPLSNCFGTPFQYISVNQPNPVRQSNPCVIVTRIPSPTLPLKAVEIEQCIPKLCSDLTEPHCRSDPSTSANRPLSASDDSTSDAKKLSGNSILKESWEEMKKQMKKRVNAQLSPSDLKMIKRALRNSKMENAIPCIENVQLINSDPMVRSQRRISNASSTSSIAEAGEAETHRPQTRSSSRKNNLMPNSCLDSCVRDNAAKSVQAPLTPPPPVLQRMQSPRKSPRKKQLKLHDTVHVSQVNRVINPSVPRVILTDFIKQEKWSPPNNVKMPVIDMVSSQNSIILPSEESSNSLQIQGTYTICCVNEDAAGNNNTAINANISGYQMGNDTQNACMVIGNTNFSSQSTRSVKEQSKSPFSSQESKSSTRSIPQVLTQNVFSSHGNKVDPLHDVTANSDELFLSQENHLLSQKRLCFENIPKVDASTSMSQLEGLSYRSNIIVVPGANNFINGTTQILHRIPEESSEELDFTFSSVQIRNMASVIFSMYK